MSTFHSIEWTGHALRLLDQRRLPQETLYLELTDYHDVVDAIRQMAVRGAPAIGAAAAYGLALVAKYSGTEDVDELRSELNEAAHALRAARPTAINLFWAIERVIKRSNDPNLKDAQSICRAVLEEANAIAKEDVQANKQIGLNALPLIPDPAKILHHCNTGSLATVDYGTALGIIRIAHEHGKQVQVYLDETRPRLQGARLSAWELNQLGIPHTVIVDGASGHVMRTIGIDLCVVGADRIAANGDVANKIGTYNLALAAHAHDVPFYVAAPISTIDLSTSNGDGIPIEERSPREIAYIGDIQLVPDGSPVLNFAFDITPAKYITAIITEIGIVYPPYRKNLITLVSKAKEEKSDNDGRSSNEKPAG